MSHKRESGGTKSFWMEETSLRLLPLEKDIGTEIAIVGAGVAGLTTAYFLARAGKKVVVVEKGQIGCGQSARTTAHLTNAFDNRYFEMERLHGQEGAFVLAESHTAAIDLMEQIVQEEKIDCDFERLPGYLFSESSEEDEMLQIEYTAARKAGVPGVTLVEKLPFEGEWFHTALLFPNQGQLHIIKYLNGLAIACQKRGVEIFGDTSVREVEEGDSHVLTTANGRTIRAPYLLLATNSPLNRNIPIHARQTPYRSYVIGIEVTAGSFPPLLAWDLKDPYHYVRLDRKEGQILIVGGEDHRTGKANDMEERYQKLETWARERFSSIGKVLYRWSGQVMEPADGIALIGENPGSTNIFVITGDSGNGMTHGTLGAKIVTDAILGRPNAWSQFYSPKRFAVKAVPEYAKDTAATGGEYKEWVSGEEVVLTNEIKKGEGGVFREGTRKICVYRDSEGALHRRSAICPHMGCIVAWNKGEKSWD